MILQRRHVVAQRVHSVGRGPFGSHIAQRIARARGHYTEVRIHRTVLRLQHPAAARSFNFQHARFFQLSAGIFGAVEQHAI